jgi:hypothetical protein
MICTFHLLISLMILTKLVMIVIVWNRNSNIHLIPNLLDRVNKGHVISADLQLQYLQWKVKRWIKIIIKCIKNLNFILYLSEDCQPLLWVLTVCSSEGQWDRNIHPSWYSPKSMVELSIAGMLDNVNCMKYLPRHLLYLSMIQMIYGKSMGLILKSTVG